MLGSKARRILAVGEIVVRVRRAGMLQLLTFRVRRVRLGNGAFAELYTDRVVDTTEVVRVANELGLPVETQNCRAFPDGMGANDFMGL